MGVYGCMAVYVGVFVYVRMELWGWVYGYTGAWVHQCLVAWPYGCMRVWVCGSMSVWLHA